MDKYKEEKEIVYRLFHGVGNLLPKVQIHWHTEGITVMLLIFVLEIIIRLEKFIISGTACTVLPGSFSSE